ncbi:unnamed protein product [Gongylonema pulchrum]|uniref:Small subunit processome component 20 homolog n=1 Tax=Gongylonema pulchrum TaxID=637853 RepID=A0A183D1P1_9BILA|nr:unnamed protein product [Gongylonema pulchrum]
MGWLARCFQSQAVQLSAARFLSLAFSTLDKDYLASRSDPSARDFLLWTVTQFRSHEMSSAFAEQVAKNITYLFDTVVRSDEALRWFCHKLCSMCKFEVVKLPNEATRRINIFKVAAAVILKVEPSHTGIVVDAFLPSLYREMQGKSAQNTEVLEQISKEVAETMKGRIGEEEFTKRISECQKQSAAKFELRKRKQKEELILDPVYATRKKLRRNKAKSGARRRKFGQKKRLRTGKSN